MNDNTIPPLEQNNCPEIIGMSPQIVTVRSLIDKVAKTLSTVLITGESGTGKELVARAIHENSDRNGKPFIVIDCSVLSESLLENELFGHEKGAFTDATSMKRGLFEVADGGTLFIDEIGEMKISTQAKLLRVIETRQFRRIGGTQQIRTDIRILAATNRNLSEEIKKGNFREDLYYRINVLNINLPSLRNRSEDIPMLVYHFIAGKKRMRQEDMLKLMQYPWPGNIRELGNAVERALVTSSEEFLTIKDFPFDLERNAGASAYPSGEKGLRELVDDFEKQLIARVIKACGNNKKEAAKLLKISRAKLYRKLQALDSHDFL